MHKLSHVVIKIDDKGKPLTALDLGLTLAQTLFRLRGGAEHVRAGVTKNHNRPRDKVRARHGQDQ